MMENSIQLNQGIFNSILMAMPEPVFIIDENGYYKSVLGGIDRSRYHDGYHLVGKRMHEVMDLELAESFLHQIRNAIQSDKVINYIYQLSSEDIKGSENLRGPKGEQWFEANISPIVPIEGTLRMVVWVAFNISEIKNAIDEKEKLIGQLQKAMSEIKTLRGILPICSICKKIRDDKGYWNQLEDYIKNHSDADLSHSICPECARNHYRNYDLYEEDPSNDD